MRKIACLSIIGLAGLSACDDGNPAAPVTPAGPMARTDDLWPGHGRVAVAALPGAAEIESACAEAWSHSIREAEKANPSLIVDPSYHEYPVRNPVCELDTGTVSTVNSRFEQA